MIRKVLTTSVAAMLATSAVAQTVNVSLTSPQNGQTVSAGATINWTISFTVSGGNNAGLALLACDLVQADTNPATLNIPPASAVPGAMANFSRPAGISNPGEGGPTGYVGVQRGTAGARNLVQIGGGQNTFGVARPPGTGVAENAVVTGGVGQSGAVTLASGSFVAPSTAGSYTFSLQNVVANALQAVNAPPNFSPVVAATAVLSAGSISFTVGGGGGLAGDIDGDGHVTLTDLAILLTNFGRTGTGLQGDIDHDGDVDLTDLATLLTNFGL